MKKSEKIKKRKMKKYFLWENIFYMKIFLCENFLFFKKIVIHTKYKCNIMFVTNNNEKLKNLFIYY